MSISFRRVNDKMRFMNPFKGFSPDEAPLEIRFDPLTEETSRVLGMDYTPPPRPDLEELVKTSLQTPCPFCPDLIKKATPLFPEGFIPEGRLVRGEACIVPNLMPLDRFTGVCVMSGSHYIAVDKFSPPILKDPFMASLDFIRRAADYDRALNTFSINWNYLPPAGSSIVHPHLQVNCGVIPTYTYRIQFESSMRYFMETGRVFWKDYIEAEKEEGERFVGDIGATSWYLSFAPHGSLPDLCCIFPEKSSLLEVTEEDMEDFIRGLTGALKYLDRQGLYSFNMSMFSGGESGHFRVNARIAPRLLLHRIGNSDQNYFQFLHRENICLKAPESARAEVTDAFGV